MKFIALILSFYFLILGVLPCADHIEASVSTSQKEVVLAVGTHSPQNNAIDLCSPFCTCHCCHVNTINFSFSNFDLMILMFSKNIFDHFVNNLGNGFSLSILQPPNLNSII